jgi:hypothetical protein
MLDANLIFIGIGVMWAYDLKHNNVFLLDPMDLSISERNNAPVSYVIAKYENL